MRLIFIGDIFGNPGMRAVGRFLREHRDQADVVVANAENAAGGFGLTRKQAEQLWGWGVDVITMGNHTWNQAEIIEVLEGSPRIVRPANYPIGTPGLGSTVVTTRSGERLCVAQIMGRVYMTALDDPFAALDTIIENAPSGVPILVDVHAEATSEKRVLAYHAAGRVAALIGTHTHVQTADEGLLKGSAVITDAGMSGVQESSIGMRFEEVHARFTSGRPHRYRPATGVATVCGVVVEIEGNRARSIERFRWREPHASDELEEGAER